LRPITPSTDEYGPKKAIVVCNEQKERVVGQVTMLPATAEDSYLM